MNNNYLLRIGGGFLIALLAYACTEDELYWGGEAEAHYVDLLYALDQEDQSAARIASARLNQNISLMRARWYRPQEDEEVDNQYFHLAKAEQAYAQCDTSLKAGDLELAAVQLDRAVYELSAADPVSFNELYVASIYDFIATWQEVSRAVHDQELCSLTWTEFSRYGKDARYAWRQVKWRKPSGRMYFFTSAEVTDFRLAHTLLDDSIDHFIDVVSTGDQCAAQVAAKEVDEALWTLILPFGGESRPLSLK